MPSPGKRESLSASPAKGAVALSYSGGKDSALALVRLQEAGYDVRALVVAANPDTGRSWFHGIPPRLFDEVGRASGIPVVPAAARRGERYAEDFSAALRRLAGGGIEACAFGDIDIAEHRAWDERTCAAAGIRALFPLWQEGREALVEEAIARGVRTIITNVDLRVLPTSLLGQELTSESVAQIAAAGADACGEMGEYHTFAFDSPAFARPVAFSTGAAGQQGNRAYLPLLPAGEP